MIDNVVSRFLFEDLGPSCRDVSTLALGPAMNQRARGQVLFKSPGVICGLLLIEQVIQAIEQILVIKPCNSSKIEFRVQDGEDISRGSSVAIIDGPINVLLGAERTLLNLLQRLSGTATLTRQFVKAMQSSNCRILDTRKTTPGLRAWEKYAVRIGGGMNHRFGLYDMVLLKDNHITAMNGNIEKAVTQAKALLGPSMKIEVETSDLQQVKEAVEAHADMILLDNMSISNLEKSVQWVRKQNPAILLEASGGITLETVSQVAATGVDFISVGALTHSAPAMDISMKITLPTKRR